MSAGVLVLADGCLIRGCACVSSCVKDSWLSLVSLSVFLDQISSEVLVPADGLTRRAFVL